MKGCTEPFLPFSRPCIGEAEIAAVVEVLRSDWITTGPVTARLEEEFGSYTRALHARAVNSCTAALHLALATHGIGPGHEVVAPSLTFAATANVIEHVGATPVFAEVEPDTFNISARTVAACLSPRTRAVIAVHYGGLPCDLGPLRALCRERDIVLVEDAAHAVGARYLGEPIGGGSDAVCFSFYANKNMTTGEGGMLTTASAEIARSVERLRMHGVSKDAWSRRGDRGPCCYDITAAGFNFVMTDIAAALARVQLRRLEGFIERRSRLVAQYRAALADLPGIGFQAEAGPGSCHAHHLFVIRLSSDEGAPSRAAVVASLSERQIGHSVHYHPLHRMTHYARRWDYAAGDLPLTERLGEELLSLPLHSDMTEAQVSRVVAAVRAAWSIGRGER